MALTQKQENFCLAFIECGDASAAYRKTYNTSRMKSVSINRKAKELMDNGKISARIEELREAIREAAQVTMEGHLNDLRVLRDAAAGKGQYGAAINAEVARGKAAGLYTERREQPDKNGGLIELARTFDLSQLTEEEAKTLEQILIKIEASAEANDRNGGPPDAGGGSDSTETNRRGKGGPTKGSRKK